MALIISSTLFWASCNGFKNPLADEDDAVARVGDVILYENDLEDLFTVKLNADDSIALREGYIDNWVRQQLILQKALANLNEEQKNKQRELQQYYNSLIRYEYEKALVQQNLDTTIKPAEVNSYYNEHKADFALKKNIIRFVYLKIPVEAPSLEKPRRWLKKNDISSKDSLHKFAVQYAANYQLDDKSWFYFSDILKEVPIETYDQEHFIKNNKHVDISDSSFIYLINIKDFKIKEDISPLEFEEQNIRNIILNKRRAVLIKEAEENIYKEALGKNTFEIYQ